MDGCSRQNPAYRLAKERPCFGGAFLLRRTPIPGVPTISRFLGISIAMFFDDHEPPHFHARHADGRAKIRIDTLEVIDGDLGRRRLRFVLAWAELHQHELVENWRNARAGETLRPVEPLR